MICKYLFIFFALLFSSMVIADSYSQSGVISDTPEETGTLIISGKTYKVDNKTVVHGLLPVGEVGPTIPVGYAIGFNTSRTKTDDNNNDLPYISEIWPLSK